MKLGYIDYLNCYPFYYYAFEKQAPEGITIVSDYPSALNRRMAQGDLDMGPISAAAYADLTESLLLLPDFCLSSIGYVRSVILVSKVPIEDLNNKKVGITTASHTSVVLLKVLLHHYFHQNPVYIPVQPRPGLKDLDAALIIGNDALAQISVPMAYVYDLGDVWLRKTGFPVVFALFAVRKKIVEQCSKEIKAVIASYQESLQCLEKEKNAVIQKAKQRYPDIVYDIDDYYDLLNFDFTDHMREALMFYYAIAADLGLLKKVERLRYLDLG